MSHICSSYHITDQGIDLINANMRCLFCLLLRCKFEKKMFLPIGIEYLKEWGFSFQVYLGLNTTAQVNINLQLYLCKH